MVMDVRRENIAGIDGRRSRFQFNILTSQLNTDQHFKLLKLIVLTRSFPILDRSKDDCKPLW